MASTSALHLCFEATQSGATILRVKNQQPPWRVVRGFPVPSGETLVHVHNLSGGILDGDVLQCEINLGAGAQAQVTSTGAMRIYRSRSTHGLASHRTHVNIAAGAYLEYLPDQLIPFAGSRFEQTTRVELDPGGSLIWWDRIAPGREASGEVFRFDSLASDFELVACGHPVAIERWTLMPFAERIDSLARLGPFRHFASCYVCRAGEPPAYWRTFEAQLQIIGDQLSSSEILWGVTSLRAHGLVIRGVAMHGSALTSGLVEFWKAAKWSLCGRVATLPRKIH
jgi:urease accessory protein